MAFDSFYQQVGSPSGPTQTNGGVNPQDQGLGVKVNTMDTEFGQGGLETTGINTDLALNGDGFFMLRNADGTGTPTYTRDGAFSLNSNGLFYDPSSGMAVMGYMADSSGNVNASGTPGAITIPVGLQEQATATGSGVKVGPTNNDDVFDVALGGNLDQTNWSQAFQNAIGASANPGAPVTVSTTFYDSLGNSHEATLTYTPVVPSAVAATSATTDANGVLTGAATYPLTGSVTTNVTVTSNGAGNAYSIADGNGNSATGTAGQTVTFDGATFTLNAAPPAAGDTATVALTAASNGLPSSVANSAGTAETPATEWQVSVSFADGTQFQTISNGGSYDGTTDTVTAAQTTQGSSGVVGYAYFDQNGQYINTSSIESVTGTNVALGSGTSGAYIHDAGGAASLQDGNQLNILQWGPSAGNNAQAPTNTASPGAIALGFFDNTSLEGSSQASVVSQNGYSAGTLSNITVGEDGSITGSFTNGQTKTLAQLAVATFQNEDGLQRLGGNQFGQTAASGLAQVGTANSGRYGAIVAGSLEESNVNLANEFTNLIVAQRAFEANSRGIQTADQNLITVTHIQASEN